MPASSEKTSRIGVRDVPSGFSFFMAPLPLELLAEAQPVTGAAT
jgi:hypothetical protein